MNLMKKKNLLFATITLVSTAIFSIVLCAGVSSSKSLLGSDNNVSENRIQLDSTNKLSEAEGGTWSNPKPSGSTFTRKTAKGNDIVFTGYFGTSLTSVDNNFCISRSSNGWFCNVTPLNGITKIIISGSSGRTFRVDFGRTKVLDGYSGTAAIPEYVNYHTDEITATGSDYVIDVPNDTFARYFRFQPTYSGNFWISKVAVEYSCVAPHEHELITHPAVAPNRGTDGNIEYQECSGCHKLFDMSGEEITQEETIDPSTQINFTAGSDASFTFAEPYLTTNKLNIDVKIEEGKHVNIALMKDSSWDYYLGYFEVNSDGSLTNAYAGVTTALLTDGYIRVIFDFSLINKVNGAVGSVNDFPQITWVYIRGGWTNGNGVADINPRCTVHVARGHKFTAGVNYSIDYKDTISLNATIHVDIFFTSDSLNTHVNVMFGQGWSDFFGYYELNKSKNSYTGLSYEELVDGYLRCSFKLSELTKLSASGIKPSFINLFYLRGGWTNANGFIDIVVDRNLTSPVIGDIY